MKLEAQEEQSRQRSWQGRGINDTFYFFGNEVNWNLQAELVTLAKSEWNEARSVSGTIPCAKHIGISNSLYFTLTTKKDMFIKTCL
ncbi:MAG: hypothetical protein ABSF13_11510 [Smithella sp.]|jgi:hypothetical protein